MIVELHKFLIYGIKEEMDRFFYLAQRAGFIEFIGIAHKKSLEMPENAKLLLSAIRIAKHYPVHPTQAPKEPHDPEKLAEKLVGLHADHEALSEEERLLTAEIARIAIFGDFSRSDIDALEIETKRTFQFFCMKSDLARDMQLPAEVIYVGTEYDLDYFVSFNREKTQYPKMIEIQIDRPVGVLRERLLRVREEMGRLESDLRTYANALPNLQHGLVECLNEYHLELAKHDASSVLNNSLFVSEAWVPRTHIKSLHALIGTLHVECEEIEIEQRDQIPTYMENKGGAKIGEDLVNVYDTPAHTDKDPSIWILVFFSLFFAMIISDAGYGFVFLLIGLFIKWKNPILDGAKKRFVKLIFILSTCCIAWGVCTASYFGIEIGPDNPFRKTSFLHFLAVKKAEYHMQVKDDVYESYVHDYPATASANDGHDFLVKAQKTVGSKTQFEALDDFYDNLLMEFSFLVGILHISLSFIRYMTRNWPGLGWIIFMIGGYLYFPSIVDATTIVNFMGWIPKPIAHAVGLQLVNLGIGFAFVAAWIKKKWGAFHELLNVVQVFADVLSYLRLYALALGGMVMAHTFNDRLGIDLGIVASVIVIAAGHINNISLCIMGGVIHGLRLNFLEWYHYCFDGGGRAFNPLRLRRSK